MLERVLPANDQCVEIDDPLTALLDRIQAGEVDSADIRYFLSRFCGSQEGDDQNADRPIDMMARSFAAFQARNAGREAEFDVKLVSLRGALDATGLAAQLVTIKIAAFSGMQVEPLAALAACIQADIDNLPATIVDWCNWLVDFLIADRASYAHLFGTDVETVKAVTRVRKPAATVLMPRWPSSSRRCRLGSLARLSPRLRPPLGLLRRGSGPASEHADFVLRLINRRFYMIAGAVTALVQHILAGANRPGTNPAALEVLAIAIRKGLNTPEKVAFAHRSPSIRSRVVLHRDYAQRIVARPDQLGLSFEAILRWIDAQLAFGAVIQLQGE